MKEGLGEDVAEVRSTGRLTDSAVVLAADDKGPDLQVQRLMRRAGRAMMPPRPILEVNPRHALIESLVAKQDDKELVQQVAVTLLDLAKVQEGEPLKDAAGFARRVSTLLAGSLAGWRPVPISLAICRRTALGQMPPTRLALAKARAGHDDPGVTGSALRWHSAQAVFHKPRHTAGNGRPAGWRVP